MTFILEIARRCELAGVHVVRAPGCERRGNGQSWATWPEGPLNHHTAGGRNIYLDRNLIDGRSDLPGPLTNFATLYDGDLVVVAAYPANHAGASGGWDTAPMPVTRLFNRQVIGNEIQYPGTEPMSPAQWRTILIFNRIVLDVIGRAGQWNRIKFHNGTSITGKWDPGYGSGKTYDIAQFRRAVAATGEDDMDANQDRMLRAIFQESTLRLPNRRDDGSDYADTVLGYAANADKFALHAINRIDQTARAIIAYEVERKARDEAMTARLDRIEKMLTTHSAPKPSA